MGQLKRTAGAVWRGDLMHGQGTMSSPEGTFRDLDYSAATRFKNEPGANPEEMLGAAHAACFSMQLSNIIASGGNEVESIQTVATVTLDEESDGYTISSIHLETVGLIPDMDGEEEFLRAVEEAKETCPISKVVQGGVENLTVDASLNREP